MILKNGNKNKELVKEWNNISFFRYPVQTKTVTKDDNLVYILHLYCDDFLEKGDIIGIAESVIAVIQGRAYKFSEISYSFLQNFYLNLLQKHQLELD